ncbi:MAG TPA: YihY/virulence factor BrkB family protein [Bryobacteraceae bacterium]|nr:YihY/virulence factor BrkB family protein [Bryobacteraceae bacterium]
MAELRADLPALGRYLIEPEAHVYAFSIAANVLLSFFPFMLVMIAICRHLLDWPAAELSLYIAIRDYFPGSTGQFLAYNLKVAADNSRRLEWVSMLLLLFTANGIFLPLEVALNKAWGVKVNRSLLKNQAVSMLLIFGCGFLVMLSAAVSGLGPVLWSGMSGQSLDAMRSTLTDRWQLNWAPMPLVGVLKLTTIPSTLLILFLVFWLLPNTKVPWRAIVPRAVVIGLFLEALKWVNLLIWPWVYAKFSREFGVFNNSVTILTWSLFAALVVLAGADWTARSVRRSIEVEKEPGGGLAQSE